MNDIKDKINQVVYRKICDAFKTSFFTKQQFENEIANCKGKIVDAFNTYVNEFNGLKNTGSTLVIRIKKEDFIIKRYNWSNVGHYNKIKVEELEKFKESQPKEYQSYLEAYDELLNENSEAVIIPVFEFIKNRTAILAKSENEVDFVVSVENIFWKYFHVEYLENYWGKKVEEDIFKSPNKIVEKFIEHYLSNRFLKLFEAAKIEINDEEFSGFEIFIVNVGEKNYQRSNAGWVNNNFNIMNNGVDYSFSNSTKDEKFSKGEFVHIFFLQKNKYLIKLSISLTETEKIEKQKNQYIVSRDCEKVSLSNDCEIQIAKHHGNETIIFDSRKDAKEFQNKLVEIRAGAGNDRRT